MQSKDLMKRAVFGAAAAATVLVAGAAQAALENRDLNGDTVVDAFYDTDLKITWLRDANVNALMNWDTAVAWATTLVVSGISGWRLPSSDTCGGFNCTGSEMGHLWYVELGNSAGAMTNTGNFQNLQDFIYWAGTEFRGGPVIPDVWVFAPGIGSRFLDYKSNSSHAMAVRDGDVAAVPEPETYALMLAGLAALAVVARRQPT